MRDEGGEEWGVRSEEGGRVVVEDVEEDEPCGSER